MNDTYPQADLRWSEHGTQCSFVAETWPPMLKDRVDRALEAELGPNWAEHVEIIGGNPP